MTQPDSVQAENELHAETLAAIDLGSNSFHMIVARLDENGTLSVIDRLREPVRLRSGLSKNGKLNKAARQRALDCLDRFSQRIKPLPDKAVRIVGTNTLRKATNAGKFVTAAEAVLGHPIEIIAGREEARLIYLGVANGLETEPGKRLVVDIGGGSTELIIGEGIQSQRRESIERGCVSSSVDFFEDGKITNSRMKRAVMHVGLAIHPVAKRFSKGHWENAIGCSGTIKSIRNIAQAEGWCDSVLTRDALYRLREEMIKAGHIDKFKFSGMSDDRRPVLAGGVAVLLAVFDHLDIDRMQVSEQSLREGLLYDLVGRICKHDVRSYTVESTIERWSVDREQADRVEAKARTLFGKCAAGWGLADEHESILAWAARLHEVGLQVSHSKYHRHGAYILMHADMPGFSQSDQAMLSALVLNHRRKFQMDAFDELAPRCQVAATHLCMILRIAVLLHRGRTSEQVPDIDIRIAPSTIEMTFPGGWLDEHPLTLADLEVEQKHLRSIGTRLWFNNA